MRLMLVILLLAIAPFLPSVETEPLEVTKVIASNLIEVKASVGNAPASIRVRLLYIVNLEALQEGKVASDFVRAAILGRFVRISCPGNEFQPDRDGIIAAVVKTCEGTIVETGTHESTVGKDANINLLMVSRGWSPYTFSDGRAPEPLGKLFDSAEGEARKFKYGIWSGDTRAPFVEQ